MPAKFTLIIVFVCISVPLVMLHACAIPPPTAADADGYELPLIVAGEQRLSTSEFRGALDGYRVVAVAEHHDRLDHHLNQLAVTRLLHSVHPDMVIGMEYFQQPFQSYLDAFVAGDITINEMLRETEYYDRWRYDFRLIEPILSFARDQKIPLLALNIPAEISRRVARGGIESLTPSQRKWVPKHIDRSNLRYRRKLEEVFADHPIAEHGGSIERLIESQLLWDEGMAQRAAEYLRQHPGRKMVLLAGRGHIEYGFGIPDRLERRLGASVAIAIQEDVIPENKDAGGTRKGHFVIQSDALRLPKAGLLGVVIDRQAESAVIAALSEDSAAGAAGVRERDVIISLNGEPVTRFADLKAGLWNRLPGEKVSITVERARNVRKSFDIVLR